MGMCCSCLSPDDVHPSTTAAAANKTRPRKPPAARRRGENKALLDTSSSSSDDDSSFNNHPLGNETPERAANRAGRGRGSPAHTPTRTASTLYRGSIRNTPQSMLAPEDELDRGALLLSSSSSSSSSSTDHDDDDDDDDEEEKAEQHTSEHEVAASPPQAERKERLHETREAQAVEAMLAERVRPIHKSASFEDFLLADFQAAQSHLITSQSSPSVAGTVASSSAGFAVASSSLPASGSASRPNMQRVRTKTGSVYELMRQDMTPFALGESVSGVTGANLLTTYFVELTAQALLSPPKLLVVRIEAAEPVLLYACRDEAPTLLSFRWMTESMESRGVHVASLAIDPSALLGGASSPASFPFFVGIAAKASACSFTFTTQLESVVLRTGEQVSNQLNYGTSKTYLIQNPCHADDQSCRATALSVLVTSQAQQVLPVEVRIPDTDDVVAASCSATEVASATGPVAIQQLRFALRPDVQNYLVTVFGWVSIPVAYSLVAQPVSAVSAPLSLSSADLSLANNSTLHYGTTYAGSLSRSQRSVEYQLPVPDLAHSWNTLGVFVESTHALMFEVRTPTQTVEGRFRLVEGSRYLGSLSLSPSDLLKEEQADDHRPWLLRVTGLSFGAEPTIPFVVTARLTAAAKQPPRSEGLLSGSLLCSMIDFFALEFQSAGTLTLDVSVAVDGQQPVYDELDPTCAQIYVRHNECPPHHKFPLIQSVDFDHFFFVPRQALSSDASSTMTKKLEVRVQAGLHFVSIVCSNSFKIDYSIGCSFATLAQPSQTSVLALRENRMSDAATQTGWTYCCTTAISNTDLTALFLAVGSDETDAPSCLFVQQGGLPTGASTDYQGTTIVHPEDSSKTVHFVCLSPRELKTSGDGVWYLGVQCQAPDGRQLALGYFLLDSCTSLPLARLPGERLAITWAAVPLRRWTYFDVDLDTDATQQHLLVEYVCSQQLVLKLKKGSIPSPITYDTPDDSEIEGPMSKISPWWRGALLISARVLAEKQSGKWYVGLQGVPRAHALLGLRVSLVPATGDTDASSSSSSSFSLPAGLELLSPEMKIIQ